ncbi:MAG: DegQ family serine endoprotease [Hyphomicrobiales bacterium]
MSVISKYNPILALGLSAFLAVPTALAQDSQQGPEVDFNDDQQAQQTQQVQQGQVPTSDFVDLAPRLIETVVNITAEIDQPAPDGQEPGQQMPPGTPFEDFFRDFFGDQDRGGGDSQPPQRRGSAVGSGFIIDAEGYIVTNNHVVEDATTLTVTLHDETEYEAEIVGRDPRTDLAVLKIDARSDLPTAEWGDSEQAQVAEPVLAVGNPFGLGGSATWGIISALARDLGIGPYDEFLQTDASINRGNSGGPVFNTRGEVIGVATAIFSPSGGNIGLGFATPSSIARSVVEQLRETGEVSRGWIGVAIQPVNEELASGLGLDEARGVVVADVTSGAPADEAGIEVGDVMLEFAGEAIDEQSRLPRLVADTEIGSTVPVTVWRDGEEVSLEITVGDLSQSPGMAEADTQQPQSPDTDAQGGLGLQLAPLDPEVREQLGLDSDVSGVLVAGVQPNSVAAERGLRTGDLITRVGRQEVKAPEDVVEAVSQAQERGDETVLMLIRRDEASRFVALPLSTTG